MEEKNEIISSKEQINNIIKKIIKKYKENDKVKITGKKLNYIKNMTIIRFYCKINKSTEINPFNSDINMSFEFIENSVPYIQILNDFITPSLNDGRNIFYCLTHCHNYIFNQLNVFEIMFDALIDGIKNFLLCLKENMEINTFVFYGEYMMNYIYSINDFLLNKNTVKLFRIIEVNEKSEQLKYIVITQLYFLIFAPINDDMSMVKLEQFYYLKDFHFSFGILFIYNKQCYNISILDETLNKTITIYFHFIETLNDKNDKNDKMETIEDKQYDEIKNILISKKKEIDLKKYKIVIVNYKPLFTFDIQILSKNTSIKDLYMYNDYKLYISYFEELIHYYKNNQEENIKNRVKKFLEYLNYCCVDFITFNDSNLEEVKIYQSKIINYFGNNNNNK